MKLEQERQKQLAKEEKLASKERNKIVEAEKMTMPEKGERSNTTVYVLQLFPTNESETFRFA